MNSMFYKQAKGRIITALKDSPCTFEELCRRCQGLYPTTVRDMVDQLNLRSKLIQLYTTDKNFFEYGRLDDCYYDENSIVTAQVQNNPVLSAWYFSWNSCYKLGQLDQWKSKRILFLGTPRLFEFFATRNFGSQLTLIDLDDKVLFALSQKYHSNLHNDYLNFYNADLGNFDAAKFRRDNPIGYDFVFFDPPWYLNHYITWINTALQLLKPYGNIVFSLFPPLIRPTASAERKELLDKCRLVSNATFVCSGALEYDIPSFERKELEMKNLYLHSNWKTADIVIMNGVLTDKHFDVDPIEDEYHAWIEFNWLNMRWFLRKTKPKYETQYLLNLSQGSRFLTSPSRRNKQWQEVNLLSSKGHGLRVSDPEYFLKIVRYIQESEATCSYHDVIDRLELDSGTKEILFQLGEDY